MESRLAKSLEGMVSYMRDMHSFFTKTDYTKSAMIKLLGRRRPGGAFTGIRVTPHDQRFKSVMVWMNKMEPTKVQSVAFHFPEYPILMSEAEKLFGEFTTKYSMRRKNTLFMHEFDEESPIQDFSFTLEKIKVERHEDGVQWAAVPPEGGEVQVVGSDSIWFDNYVFFLRDREWPEDPYDDGGNASMMSMFRGKGKKGGKGGPPAGGPK